MESRLDREDVEIVGSAPDVEMAVEELTHKEVDLALVGVDAESHGDLLDILEESQLMHETPLILLVQRSSPNFVEQAFRIGVRGILPPEIEADSLNSALAAVANGLVVLSPENIGAVQSMNGRAVEDRESIEVLTPREREVLQKMASGLANKEIAVRMRISEHTAKFHVASILSKLGAVSRTEAVSIGMRRGLILL